MIYLLLNNKEGNFLFLNLNLPATSKTEKASSFYDGSIIISISSRTHCRFSSSPSLRLRSTSLSLFPTVRPSLFHSQNCFCFLFVFPYRFVWCLFNATCRFDTDGELLLKSKSSSRDEESVSLLSSGDSKRCVSTVTSEDASSSEIRAHKLRIIAVVARCHEVKLKVHILLFGLIYMIM